MSKNVIEAPERFRDQRKDGALRNPDANEQRIRDIERKKLEEINDRHRKSPLLRFLKRDDRLRAARALGELRKEYLDRGQLAEVKQSFEKIHRFMISPDLDLQNASADKPTKKLFGKVSQYLEAAQTIAKVAGRDVTEAQLRVLRETQFWQEEHWKNGASLSPNNSAARDDDLAAERVAWLIGEMSARVIRDSNLAKLFACMRRVPGQWDLGAEAFRQSGMACLFQTAYQEWNEHWSEAPPLPSVPLVRLRHADWRLKVRVAPDGSGRSDAAETWVDAYSKQPLADDNSETFEAEITLYREIRLALGPTVNAETLGPLFESRPYSEIRLRASDGSDLSSGRLDPGHLHSINENANAVLLDGVWRSITPCADPPIEEAVDVTAGRPPEPIISPGESYSNGLHIDNPFFWDWLPLNPDRAWNGGKQCFENDYLSWIPGDAAYVAHWLGRDEPGSHPVEHLPATTTSELVRETWYPSPNLGRLVEAAISDGRLEAALKSEIEHIRKAFEQHETDWRERMQEQTARQIAEFKSDLAAAAPSSNESRDTDDDQHS